jgi:hypothetical protein
MKVHLSRACLDLLDIEAIVMDMSFFPMVEPNTPNPLASPVVF